MSYTAHELTPDAYRKRWGLAPDYPLVAPKYAELRSKLAKKIGVTLTLPCAGDGRCCSLRGPSLMATT
ncbi:MAG: MucR family transcriptional regulator, partial [Acidiferrobacterales bacterium]